MTGEGAALALVDAFAAALNRRDAGRLADLFTRDADFVDFMGHWLAGRTAIRDGHTEAFTHLLSSGTLTYTEVRPAPLDADLWLCHAVWIIPAHRQADGGELPDRRGVLTFVISTAEGQTSIRAGHNTEIRAL